MNDIALVPAGFFAGFLAGPLISHWLRLLLEILGVRGVAMPSGTPQRKRWYLPLMLLHPVTWLLAAIVYYTIRVVSGQMPQGWIWFAAGFHGSFLLLATLVFIAMRRRKQAKSPSTEG